MVTAREDVGGFAVLTDERARILEYLTHHTRETLQGAAGFLPDTVEYVLSAPGKLLRPLLLLDSCRAAGGDPNLVLPAAAGTEFGHIASLVHDDIMDGDAERRGQPTLHTRNDIPTALLTGDYLIFETFLSYTECNQLGVSADHVLEAIRTLSRTCLEMCQGQALEAEVAGNLATSEATYLELIRLKTASFCRAAARIGACLAAAPDAYVQALANYGTHLGMAFQIMDDILCYDGNASLMGKPVSSDMRNHRVTLPIIYALQSNAAGVRARVAALMDAGDRPEAHAELVKLLHATRALERARAKAYHYTEQARNELDLLPPSDAHDRLVALADIFLARDH